MNYYKLIQDDCLPILKTIKSETFNLAILDPPYNIGIAEWDKIENYIEWLYQRLIEVQRVLKNNGTMWFFHNDFVALTKIQKMIEDETDFIFKQFITIDKGLQSIVGRTSDNLRSYPTASEYLVFYTFEDLTGSQQLSEKYSRINPMAKYLKNEFERAKVTNREIAGLFPSKTGGFTGCVSNWLLGLNFPTKDQYNKMKEYLNKGQGFEYLRQDYEDLRQDYEDLRYTFNLQKGVTDVWSINFYEDNIRWHPTAKPIKLIKRIIETSTNPNDLVLDPFLGSGTTMEACQQLGRNCLGIEKKEKYIKKIKKRCWGKQFLDREVKYEFFQENTHLTEETDADNPAV